MCISPNWPIIAPRLTASLNFTNIFGVALGRKGPGGCLVAEFSKLGGKYIKHEIDHALQNMSHSYTNPLTCYMWLGVECTSLNTEKGFLVKICSPALKI